MIDNVKDMTASQLRELIETARTRLRELKATGEPWAVRLWRTREVREWSSIWVAAESEEAAVAAALASEDDLRESHSYLWEPEDDEVITSFEAHSDGPADLEGVDYVVGPDGRLEYVE